MAVHVRDAVSRHVHAVWRGEFFEHVYERGVDVWHVVHVEHVQDVLRVLQREGVPVVPSVDEFCGEHDVRVRGGGAAGDVPRPASDGHNVQPVDVLGVFWLRVGEHPSREPGVHELFGGAGAAERSDVGLDDVFDIGHSERGADADDVHDDVGDGWSELPGHVLPSGAVVFGDADEGVAHVQDERVLRVVFDKGHGDAAGGAERGVQLGSGEQRGLDGSVVSDGVEVRDRRGFVDQLLAVDVVPVRACDAEWRRVRDDRAYPL